MNLSPTEAQPGANEDEIDPYAHYADSEETESFARQKRQGVRRERFVEEVTDAAEMPTGFTMTYKPSRHEKGWLLDSLGSFYQQNLITDVLASVKGGKEASVYRCQPGPALAAQGIEFVAAKVYRPRQLRSLRNDKMYREGRPVLTADGKAVKKTDSRMMRALGKNTDFGKQVAHTSWLMYEFTTLENLHQAGAAVPRAFSASDNALLMSYHGDENRAAPTLSEIHLPQNEAKPLLHETLRNIELLLDADLIHGDLSAYNILYWEGRITLIDFPQVSSLQGNSKAEFILQRDITRVCEYFSRCGAACDPEAIFRRLWNRYGGH